MRVLLCFSLFVSTALASPCDHVESWQGHPYVKEISALWECTTIAARWPIKHSAGCFIEFIDHTGDFRGGFQDKENNVLIWTSNHPGKLGGDYAAYFRNEDAVFGTLRYSFSGAKGTISVEKDFGLAGSYHYGAKCLEVDSAQIAN